MDFWLKLLRWAAFDLRSPSRVEFRGTYCGKMEKLFLQELTISSHDFTIDLGRETGGAIGPITDDDQPILTNLTFSMGYVKQGDIVFLTTDGVSDNFDPVIEKHADHNSKSTDVSI